MSAAAGGLLAEFAQTVAEEEALHAETQLRQAAATSATAAGDELQGRLAAAGAAVSTRTGEKHTLLKSACRG